jgi:hypothetical protein
MTSDNYLFGLVWNRMREMGYRKYHVKTEVIDVTGIGTPVLLNAYNEYYYLVSTQVPDDTEIISDTNYYKAKNHGLLELHGMQEFSGKIAIKRGSADTRLEFLRVLVEK